VFSARCILLVLGLYVFLLRGTSVVVVLSYRCFRCFRVSFKGDECFLRVLVVFCSVFVVFF
jgi:hypothetical protein